MTDVWGALSQVMPSAGVLTDAYTCPSSKRATVQVITCNTSGASVTIRASHAVSGAADNLKQYVMYGKTVVAGDSVVTAKVTLAGGDVLRVYASAANITFNINGIEETAT